MIKTEVIGLLGQGLGIQASHSLTRIRGMHNERATRTTVGERPETDSGQRDAIYYSRIVAIGSL